LLAEGGVGLLACLVGPALGRRPWQSIAWQLEGAMIGLAATLPLLVALVWLMQSNWSPVSRLKAIVTRFVAEIFRDASWLELAAVSLLAGVGEELMFRALIQDLIASWWATWAGLLVGSLLFGLAHPISTTYVVFATMMGLYLGALYILASGNLLAPIVTHAVYDFVALAWLVHRARKRPTDHGVDDEGHRAS
jgi:membrane protease YdiL (CAAX protease family)